MLFGTRDAHARRGLFSPRARAALNVIPRGEALAAREPSPTLAGMKASHLILAMLVTVAAGCSRSSADRAPSRTADEGSRIEPQPAGQQGPTARTDERPLAVSGIVIDPQIGELCQIEVAPQSFVEFDASNPGADQVLTSVIACLTTGPLKDREVELVGHADARAADDFDAQYGRSRAQSVKDYLTGQGIAADHVTTRSVGKSGAHPLAASAPTDLAIERRVDIVLVPMP
jgi:outer membrane protein OmpA-like peptidoglycan-associated protein